MQDGSGFSASPVHFVGSIPLASSRDVMRALGSQFPETLRRIPDGETGERTNWIVFQQDVIGALPGAKLAGNTQDARSAAAKTPMRGQYRIDPATRLDASSFGALGYAKAALASWREFDALAKAGTIGADARYMVALPSPYNIISFSVHPDSQAMVEPAYEARLLQELDEILDTIPHQKLSIQWDCAHDMQAFDGARQPWFEPAKPGIIERLVRLGNHVPTGVELGYHLCYGSYGGRHFVEPKSTAAMVELANGLSAGLTRRLDYLHMPVPVERDDDAYFEPLLALDLPQECEFYLGLVHDSDGIDGTLRRYHKAREYVSRFGIATECGFGRRPPEDVPHLLELHKQAMDKIDAHFNPSR